ncbi:MAG: hypothetical protein PF518_04745 [Spirochaetaceae bacterium]|jgi:RecA/RadA recombinase|nr:hypothetical protein [Spirochaetaceae bacterium]
MSKTDDKIAELKKGLRSSTKEVKMKKEFARTGCFLMDVFFGGGDGLGIPYGTMVNMCGLPSSGKSLLGNEMIAAEYHRRKEKFKHQFEDSEGGNEFDTVEMYGFDIMGNNLLLTHPKAKKFKPAPETVEDFDSRLTIFLNLLPKDKYGIYFQDSLDAITDAENQKRAEKRAEKYEKGETFDDGTFGTGGAKFLSQEFFKNQGAKIRQRKAIVCIISQVRDKLGASKYDPNKLRTTGGRSKKHWMGIEVWFKVICDLKNDDSDLANGVYVEAKGVKTRDGRIKRKMNFLFYTDYGIDDVGTSIDYIYNLRSKSGELLKSLVKDIPWGDADKPKADLAGVTSWLKEDEKRMEAYREFRMDIDGKKNIKASTVLEFSQSSEDLKKSFVDYFGKTYTRDELHLACRKDPAMKKELDTRVRKKWEDLEEASKSGLGRKYG